MKIDRNQVYNKCDGHCGYCGQPIEFKDMQVDHMKPKCEGVDNHIDNLLPTCRQCNHYKRGSNVEWFRRSMLTLHERILKVYIHKVAINFGMATLIPFDGVFYFEKQKPNNT